MPFTNIDPALQKPRYLALPETHPFQAASNHAEPIVDAITRWDQGDEPWNHVRYSSANAGQETFGQPHHSFSQYRQGPCSEAGSYAPVSDSGYHTQAPQSMLNNDLDHVEQDLPTQPMVQTRALNMQSVPTESHGMRRIPSDQRSISQHSNRSGNPKQQVQCSEPGCSTVSKCKSDHKYVQGWSQLTRSAR